MLNLTTARSLVSGTKLHIQFSRSHTYVHELGYRCEKFSLLVEWFTFQYSSFKQALMIHVGVISQNLRIHDEYKKKKITVCDILYKKYNYHSCFFQGYLIASHNHLQSTCSCSFYKNKKGLNRIGWKCPRHLIQSP